MGGEQIEKDPTSAKYGKVLLIFLILSLLPLLLNLEKVGFIEDEGIRGLVALEMDISGNYITPTLNGEAYFKKPPLWNWILLAGYKVLGPSVFSSRLPTVLFLLLSCVAIFYGFRKHFGEKQAMIVALLYLTCGRILFWDSMLALIDICFSFVIFLMFLWIYEKGRKEQFYQLYMGAYFLASIGFLLKALPALVFLGFSIFAYLLYIKKWKKLISLEHAAGFGVFLIIVGGYLLAFSQYLPLEDLLKTWFIESSQRTAIKYEIWDSIRHLFEFPLEMFYHFLPWSLLLIFFFYKRNWKLLKEHSMASFCMLLFAANIWVYWTSPNVFPRYILMLFPLLYAPCVYLYFHEENKQVRKYLDVFFMGATLIVIPLLWIAPFIPDTANVSMLFPKLILISSLIIGLVVYMRKNPGNRIFHFCISLMIVRLGFDLLILPTRADNDWSHYVRIDAEQIGEKYKDEDLEVLKYNHLRYETGFYITVERNQILRYTSEVGSKNLIVHPQHHKEIVDKFPVIDSMRVQWEGEKVYILSVN